MLDRPINDNTCFSKNSPEITLTSSLCFECLMLKNNNKTEYSLVLDPLLAHFSVGTQEYDLTTKKQIEGYKIQADTMVNGFHLL